eukprot:scaffold4477_cov77-Skeletonema_marinoi.AAC.2
MLGQVRHIQIVSFVDNVLSSHMCAYTLERGIPMWILAILADGRVHLLLWNLISLWYRDGVLAAYQDRVQGDVFFAHTVSYLSTQSLMVVCILDSRYHCIRHLVVRVSIESGALKEMHLNLMDYPFLDVSQVDHQKTQETLSE